MEEKLKLVFSLCSLFVGGQKKLKRKISYNDSRAEGVAEFKAHPVSTHDKPNNEIRTFKLAAAPAITFCPLLTAVKLAGCREGLHER